MLEITYAVYSLVSVYVTAGLGVAEEVGGITVTVQPAVFGSGEGAVVSYNGRKVAIVPIGYLSVEEHSNRLMSVIKRMRDVH